MTKPVVTRSGRRRRLARGQARHVLGASATLGVWMMIFWPQVERRQQLADVAAQHPTRMSEAVHGLCKTERGAVALNAMLDEADEPTQRAVAALADELGCLDALAPHAQAIYWLTSDSAAASSRLVALGAPVAEPVLSALRGADPQRRVVAMRAWPGLAPSLTLDQRRRGERWLREIEASERGSLLGLELTQRAGFDLDALIEQAAPKMPALGASKPVAPGGVLYVGGGGSEQGDSAQVDESSEEGN
jgi:hypothetical protein